MGPPHGVRHPGKRVRQAASASNESTGNARVCLPVFPPCLIPSAASICTRRSATADAGASSPGTNRGRRHGQHHAENSTYGQE